MEYITVREAAMKWKISQRLVQKYCAQGRIEGVGKFGTSWRIPSDAKKPEDPRKEKMSSLSMENMTHREAFSDLMPLMNTAFQPGKCMEYIDRMESGAKKDIALAEYYYFCGNAEEAVQKAELYLNSPEISLKLSACLICAYANLSLGQVHRTQFSLYEVRNTLLSSGEQTPKELKAGETFVSFAAAVLLHLPLPEFVPNILDYLAILPPGLQMFSLYVQAHYLYLKEEYGKSLGVVEAALAMQEKVYPIPSIYLHLVAVMDYISMKQPEQAQQQLLKAWELAYPDDLIEAFGEHHGLIGGTLEAVFKKEWPEDFKRIIDITYRFSEGWRKIHNPVTGHEVADNLTTTEFAVAMLAARGWTNQEIGQHMNISTNTIKRYISVALQKLHITRRADLKRYMLQ